MLRCGSSAFDPKPTVPTAKRRAGNPGCAMLKFAYGISMDATMKARAPTDDTGTWLLSLPPTPRQTRLAVVVAGTLLIAVAVLGPFASIPLARLDSFIPAFEGTIFVTHLVTSILLFSQFSIDRSSALLVLACGYLFSALTLPAHGLTFPGAFSPSGLLGAGLQTTAWIYWFWHYGFALALLAYGLLRDVKPSGWVADAPISAVIGGSAAVVAALSGGLILLATAGNDLMPRLALDRVNIATLNHVVGWVCLLLCASALAVLWVRRRSVLDQWLMVVAVAAISELALAVLTVSARYSLGFYAGRIFSFLTSTIVLVVLLAATSRLYAGVARANMMLQRERNNRLMNIEAMTAAIAHEVRQPLTALVANAGAARIFLRRVPPNAAEADSLVGKAIDAAHSVSGIFDNIRDLCRETNSQERLVDLNNVIRRALVVSAEDLRGVNVDEQLAANLPPVMGHPGQLQEVVTNLVHNAVEAMSTIDDSPRMLRVRTEHTDGTVTLLVEDSGPGFDPSGIHQVFDAFVTSKPGGMGLGLAICRMIVDRHGGRISASPADPRGAVLRVDLLAADLRAAEARVTH
jgi:signal transduction histidine kinase